MVLFRHCLLVATCFLLSGPSSHVLAAPKLATVFGNRMVLQQGRPLKIWGTADSKTKITVTFAGQTQTTVTDADGNWSVTLEGLQASSTPRNLVVEANTSRTVVHEVLVGDVWLCGGQSNMAMTLRSTVNRDLEIASADFRSIRFLRVPLISRGTPQSDLPTPKPKSGEGNWQLATTENVGNCTGVGYHFGKVLHRMLKIPIGLVDVSWGGTMAQHWVAEAKLKPIPAMAPYFEQYACLLYTSPSPRD